MHVIARGRLSIYEQDGRHQLQIEAVEPKGIGAAELALRQLKTRLQAKGYFDRTRKRALHTHPRRVAIVTSAKGAAIRDMLELFAQRWPSCEVIVRPTRVQGEGAADDLAISMRMLADLHSSRKLQFHAIIIGRGGGSSEDLMAFNAEVVADAIYQSPVPVISAVGHEIDVTIADLVADHRAETPTAAVVMLAPNRLEVRRIVGEYGNRFESVLQRRILLAKQRLEHLAARPALRRPLQRFRELEKRLDETGERLHRAARGRIAASSEKLAAIGSQLETLSPLKVLGRGYSLTHSADGQLLRDAAAVQPGDRIVTRLAIGEIESIVR
jgi:exodeoxyribonuclease VII large subunit